MESSRSDDGPVGVAIAHPDTQGTEAELLALWVHPGHAGEGVAAELLSRVASSVADRDVDTLRASVPADSPSAQEFFIAHGFEPRETRRGHAGDEAIVVADASELR